MATHQQRETEESETEDALTPARRLSDSAALPAGIRTIDAMETLRACVAYENTHANRLAVLARLDRHAASLRVDTEIQR